MSSAPENPAPENPAPENPAPENPEPWAEVAPRWVGRPRRLMVNVAELRKRLGQRQEERVDIILDPLVVVGTRTVEEPVAGSVTVESIERGVSVYGSVIFSWEGDCRRCLESVEDAVEIDIHEIFQMHAPDDSDLIDFDGDQIDLVPIVRDAVALSLPLAPLCGEDCAGPDPDRYPAVTVDGLEEETGPDPRWAALDQLDLDG